MPWLLGADPGFCKGGGGGGLSAELQGLNRFRLNTAIVGLKVLTLWSRPEYGLTGVNPEFLKRGVHLRYTSKKNQGFQEGVYLWAQC